MNPNIAIPGEEVRSGMLSSFQKSLAGKPFRGIGRGLANAFKTGALFEPGPADLVSLVPQMIYTYAQGPGDPYSVPLADRGGKMGDSMFRGAPKDYFPGSRATYAGHYGTSGYLLPEPGNSATNPADVAGFKLPEPQWLKFRTPKVYPRPSPAKPKAPSRSPLQPAGTPSVYLPAVAAGLAAASSGAYLGYRGYRGLRYRKRKKRKFGKVESMEQYARRRGLALPLMRELRSNGYSSFSPAAF